MAKKKAVKPKTKRVVEDEDDFYSRTVRDLSSGKQEFWSPPPKKSLIRVVPFTHNGVKEVFLKTGTHFWPKTPGKKGLACPCLDDCPICEMQSQFTKETWKDIESRGQFKCNTWILSPLGEGHDEPYLTIANLSWGAVAGNPREAKPGMKDFFPGQSQGIPDLLHPTKGRNFQINKTGEGLGTRYAISVDAKPSPVPQGEGEVVDLIEKFATQDLSEKIEEFLKRCKELV